MAVTTSLGIICCHPVTDLEAFHGSSNLDDFSRCLVTCYDRHARFEVTVSAELAQSILYTIFGQSHCKSFKFTMDVQVGSADSARFNFVIISVK